VGADELQSLSQSTFCVNYSVYICSLFHSNLTDRLIKSMEFNVLDSLNTQLIRPVSE